VSVTSLPDGKAGIAVTDHGVGVRKGFENMLFRYDEKTHTRGTLGESGTGLGLPLSRDIMLAHDGALEYSPLEDSGSRFMAILPTVTPRILVVEKDMAIARLLKQALEAEDVEFVTAADFDTARKVIGANSIHLVIADLENDSESGLEFIKFTTKKDAKEIPVLAITLGHQADEAAKALSAGAVDFVTKPLDVETMIARARRIII